MAHDQLVNQVYMTTDYEKFKFIHGNRLLITAHIKRLEQSLSKKQLMSLVIVNERYEIIDGQHRFTVCKNLGLPLYYMMVSGYALEEVQIFNQNSSNWTKQTHLDSFCELGFSEYLKFKKFMTDFPDLKFQACERLLTLSNAHNCQTIEGKRVHAKSFEEGKLTIPDIKKSYDYAKKILELSTYYKGFNRGTFVSAMLAVFKIKAYEHSELIKKLKLQPTALVDCSNVEQYKLLIEDIYNFRRSEKVNLRF